MGFCVCFSLGYLHPNQKTEESLIVADKIQIQTKVIYKESVVTKVEYVQVHDKHQVVDRKVVEVVSKDGTVTKTTEEHLDTKEKTETKSNTEETKVVQSEIDTKEKRETNVEQHRLHEETNKIPDYKIGVLAGVSVKSLTDLNLKSISSNPIVYGGEFERRIFGSAWAGLWFTTEGSGGVKLSLEF